VRFESGDRIFAASAMAAVKQWIYDPLDHPVEFKTRATVTFTLPKN